ncbi:MAG: LysR family transcriptional regulator [Candidatus Dactylopiibacterium carminicum]|uniref:LysR family transcriptional regulator n=1 Tax=Candidatus Dactylopiibacterium carminicum TaxID=857335 RepID=A0A272ENZ9_9RHOO|nr:LysR family transcriptional regulator [Candidatus Dactylopiibacterium carminicum]KAF7597800.1 LysR family transcriptional regulator [Candidatus Dactylopiibacterium carminicum]PAS91390.1 MAG: LysR family transcriptional regulator [Candidatus Dactylopiibacterium carminicum]PAS92493.1 MAG: LysR family transcriptional regulator [Candidatus Dactylopiibacterium carminicum]PAS95593.1 MAG: LysR family transcriptional regulator [Candidatus Dactylopiibacterium carminicum]
MDRFAAMNVFCKVVELGSLVAAAKHLEMSTSAVSRQLAQLEALLDARLLNRSTRRISLTENGRAYYERCLLLLADLEEAEEMVGNATASPRGTLRITAPVSFGASHLAPALGEFARRHPAMKFDVQLADRPLDLVEEGLDLAIRIGRAAHQNLVARRIGNVALLTCASSDYLARHGTPQTPRELSSHACFAYAYAQEPNQWRFQRGNETVQEISFDASIGANNGTVLAELAAAGLGITRAPDFILGPLVAEGRLQTILEEWPGPPLPIYAMYPSRKHLSARVRSFVEFMEGWLARQPQ